MVQTSTLFPCPEKQADSLGKPCQPQGLQVSLGVGWGREPRTELVLGPTCGLMDPPSSQPLAPLTPYVIREQNLRGTPHAQKSQRALALSLLVSSKHFQAGTESTYLS